MSSIASLQKRLARAREKLSPRPRETRLPYVCLNDEGNALPGYEDHNAEHFQLARQLGIPAQVYLFDPNDDGIEP